MPAPRADELIRQWLKLTGLRQADLARHCGMSRLTVNHYWKRRRIPLDTNRRKLLKAVQDALSVEAVP